MKYFRQGDIVQFKRFSNIYSLAIQLYNYKTYGHFGATHTTHIVNQDKEFIYLAEAKGNKPYKIYQHSKKDVLKRLKTGKIYVLRPEKIRNIPKHTNKYLGRHYDWISVWGIILKSLFGIKSKIANLFKGDLFFICSEGTLRVLYDSSNKRIDLKKEFGTDFDFIAPITLDKSKHFRRIYG